MTFHHHYRVSVVWSFGWPELIYLCLEPQNSQWFWLLKNLIAKLILQGNFFWDLKYPYSRQYAEGKCKRGSICIKGSSYKTSLSINVMTPTCYKCPLCKKYHFITGYLTTLVSFRWREIVKASPQEPVYKYQRDGHISRPTKIKYHIYLGCILRHVLKTVSTYL